MAPPTSFSELVELLGLTDEESLEVFGASALDALGGALEERPELAVLLALSRESAEQIGAPTLRRWLRSSGPHGRPIELLTRRDFAAFEDALETLGQQGYVIRGSQRPPDH